MFKETQLLTVDEARAELRVGRTLFYDLVRRGYIRLIKIGRCSRTKSEDITKLISDIADGKVAL